MQVRPSNHSSRNGTSSHRFARLVSLSTLGVIALLAAGCGSRSQDASGDAPPPGDSRAGTTCTAPAPGEPMRITGDCVDPRFNDPYVFVAVDELRQLPVPHRFVYGGFRGTDAKFAFYFPDAAQYQGRFFQGPVHQLRLTGEIASQARSNSPSTAGPT